MGELLTVVGFISAFIGLGIGIGYWLWG